MLSAPASFIVNLYEGNFYIPEETELESLRKYGICCPRGAGSVDPYIDLGGLMYEARVGLSGSVDPYIDLYGLMDEARVWLSGSVYRSQWSNV